MLLCLGVGNQSIAGSVGAGLVNSDLLDTNDVWPSIPENLDCAIPDNMSVELSVLDCAPLELFWEENWVSCASLTSLDSVDTIGMSITEGSLSSMPMSLFMASTSACHKM